MTDEPMKMEIIEKLFAPWYVGQRDQIFFLSICMEVEVYVIILGLFYKL